MNDFEKWWYEIGSGIAALPDHDFEEHGGRMAKVAWETATEQLRKERDEAIKELAMSRWEAKYSIDGLIKERDVTRLLYCSVVSNSLPHGTSAEDVAGSMGWDFYKKKETK